MSATPPVTPAPMSRTAASCGEPGGGTGRGGATTTTPGPRPGASTSGGTPGGAGALVSAGPTGRSGSPSALVVGAAGAGAEGGARRGGAPTRGRPTGPGSGPATGQATGPGTGTGVHRVRPDRRPTATLRPETTSTPGPTTPVGWLRRGTVRRLLRTRDRRAIAPTTSTPTATAMSIAATTTAAGTGATEAAGQRPMVCRRGATGPARPRGIGPGRRPDNSRHTSNHRRANGPRINSRRPNNRVRGRAQVASSRPDRRRRATPAAAP